MAELYEGTADVVLVTGATGTTGGLVLRELAARGVSARAASRHPVGRETVRFDWDDPTTFDAALAGVRAVYLVPPPGVLDTADVVGPFLRRGAEQTLTRVVLLGAVSVEAGEPGVGQLYDVLPEVVPEWAILRPSWFMQNTIGDNSQARSLRAKRTVRTATGDGALPFIDARDIAAVAAVLLTEPAITNGQFVLTGPQALTYDQLAAEITAASGRPVRHERLSAEQVRDELHADLPRGFAAALAQMDVDIAGGRWREVTDEVERVTGRPARTFADFAADHRAEWA